MGRVDFYLLSQEGKASRQVFACRLAEKAWRMENTVHILTHDTDDARRMDDLLWTFRDGSFVPHEIDGAQASSPVVIGINPAGDGRGADLLINLTDEFPAMSAAFPRVAEIVTSDDETTRRGRRLYAQYRDADHDLEMHKL